MFYSGNYRLRWSDPFKKQCFSKFYSGVKVLEISNNVPQNLPIFGKLNRPNFIVDARKVEVLMRSDF